MIVKETVTEVIAYKICKWSDTIKTESASQLAAAYKQNT